MATHTEPLTVPVVPERHSSVAYNFSLTRGGPLYRLQLRLGMAPVLILGTPVDQLIRTVLKLIA
jgi:hypothetical protein